MAGLSRPISSERRRCSCWHIIISLWRPRSAHLGSVWQYVNLTIYPLPFAIKAVSIFLSALAPFLGGFLDRSATHKPLGVALALIGITIFPPIAWSHYFVVLAVPAMILWDKIGGRTWLCVTIVMRLLLNMPYLAVIPYPLANVTAVTHYYSQPFLQWHASACSDPLDDLQEIARNASAQALGICKITVGFPQAGFPRAGWDGLAARPKFAGTETAKPTPAASLAILGNRRRCVIASPWNRALQSRYSGPHRDGSAKPQGCRDMLHRTMPRQAALCRPP